MITRAQAEALLTLAESLEACERLGIGFAADERGKVSLRSSDPSSDVELSGFSAFAVRVALRVDRLRAKGVF